MPQIKPKQVTTVPYPDVRVDVCTGKNAIDMSRAQALLGWQVESKTVKFGDDYLLIDEEGNKVCCSNNTKNRPLNDQWARTLGQDMLNRKWKLNLETIIIGKSGQIQSGQHRLVGLILACQMWHKAKKGNQWLALWPTPPVMETLVAFGADESDDVTQTLDNVRPRTLADTLYTSSMFKDWAPKDRKNTVRIADYAVRLLWERTGMARSRYTAKMTNSEAYEFLNRHLKVLEAVKHIYKEDIDSSIRGAIGLGYAVGLMFIQGASADSRDDYENQSPPSESSLKMAKWGTAMRFWIDFSMSDKFKEVKALMSREDEDGQRMCVTARIGVVVKAWLAFVAGRSLTENEVDLCYESDANGNQYPVEFPSLGGIDLGPSQAMDQELDVNGDERERESKPRLSWSSQKMT